MAINSKAEQIALDDSGKITTVQICIVLIDQFQCFSQLHHCRHFMLAGTAAGTRATKPVHRLGKYGKANGISGDVQ